MPEFIPFTFGRSRGARGERLGNGSTYLFVVPWQVTDVGGVNQVVLNLYRLIEAAGTYLPRIWVLSWPHARASTVSEQGRSVTYMRVRSPIGKRMDVAALARWVVFLVPDLIRIRRFLRVNHVACVNVHYPSLATLQVLLATCLFAPRPKLILSFHGLDLADATHAVGVKRWLWKVLLRRAHAVATCSRAQTRSVLAFEPSIQSRVATIHNGVDFDRLTGAPNAAAGLPYRLVGRRFILSVASYERKKGLDTLITALHVVRNTYGIDAVLALVGPDLGSGDELRVLAKRLGISESVVFCGEVPHEDLHVYYRGAEVFCLPSRAEPFGIVLLEAAAFRCPIVATSVGGIPEILEHDVNACLVPPDDPAALAAQVQRLLRDAKTCGRLVDALYEHVGKRFPWEKAHAAYMKLAGDAPVSSEDLRGNSPDWVGKNGHRRSCAVGRSHPLEIAKDSSEISRPLM